MSAAQVATHLLNARMKCAQNLASNRWEQPIAGNVTVPAFVLFAPSMSYACHFTYEKISHFLIKNTIMRYFFVYPSNLYLRPGNATNTLTQKCQENSHSFRKFNHIMVMNTKVIYDLSKKRVDYHTISIIIIGRNSRN